MSDKQSVSQPFSLLLPRAAGAGRRVDDRIHLSLLDKEGIAFPPHHPPLSLSLQGSLCVSCAVCCVWIVGGVSVDQSSGRKTRA